MEVKDQKGMEERKLGTINFETRLAAPASLFLLLLFFFIFGRFSGGYVAVIYVTFGPECLQEMR